MTFFNPYFWWAAEMKLFGLCPLASHQNTNPNENSQGVRNLVWQTVNRFLEKCAQLSGVWLLALRGPESFEFLADTRLRSSPLPSNFVSVAEMFCLFIWNTLTSKTPVKTGWDCHTGSTVERQIENIHTYTCLGRSFQSRQKWCRQKNRQLSTLPNQIDQGQVYSSRGHKKKFRSACVEVECSDSTPRWWVRIPGG